MDSEQMLSPTLLKIPDFKMNPLRMGMTLGVLGIMTWIMSTPKILQQITKLFRGGEQCLINTKIPTEF